MVKKLILGLLLMFLFAVGAYSANGSGRLADGREIYRSGCAACHGVDGRGTEDGMRGFEKPDTFPDFTACVATAREPDSFWRAIIRNGGPGRGFSEIMPAFRTALADDQIAAVMAYLRQLCRQEKWPRGELNLPRPLVAEKAFPEDETVLDFAINTEGNAQVANKIVYERRFGARGQLDVMLPFGFHKSGSGEWQGGVGDLVAGYKQVVLSSLASGSILSVAGEASFPTGNLSQGMGKGVMVFEGFASYGQLLPKTGFIQFQGGIELPTNTDEVKRAVFLRTVLGRSFAAGKGSGRLWSPMVELLADRELAAGNRINWDIVPQCQVTLSRRQHIRANIGLRLPINDFAPRPTQLLFYLMWDWFDGGLLDGWK